jgi:MFS family permease
VTAAGGDATPSMRTGYVWTMAVSRLGSAIAGIATAFVAYDRSRSVVVTAVITVASGIPIILLAAPASTLVQRLGAARVFVVTGIGLGLLALVPVGLSVAGRLDAASLFWWQLASGVVAGLGGPANPLLVRHLADPDAIPEFNARIGRSASVSAITGLLIGGAVVSSVGETWAYALNAASYLPAIVLVATFMSRLPPRRHAPRRLRDGLRTVTTVPGLKAAFAGAAVLNLLATPVISTFPALAKSVDDGANALAMLLAAYAAGGLFVATAVKWLHGRESWAIVGRWSLLVSGIGLAALGVAVAFGGGKGVVLAITLVALLPTGLAVAIDSTMLSSLVQLGAPEDDRGPVLAAYGTLASFVAPIGGLAIGVLADSISVSFAVIMSGVLLVVASVLTRIMGMFRAIDDLDHPELPRHAAAARRPPAHGHELHDHPVHAHVTVEG